MGLFCENDPIEKIEAGLFEGAISPIAAPLPPRLFLACSGGLDSMLLLHLLAGWAKRRGFILEVLHVNYGLRGDESDADARFVGEAAGGLGLSCQVLAVAASERPAQGIQDWARELRYRWFRELCGPDGWIVLAHHADDLAETVLMRLCRGAGLGGLPSMLPFKDRLWRPLLKLTREDIQNLATRLKIAHREDSSNAKMDYSRNRVRHLILPELERLFPGVRSHLCSLSEDSGQWLALLAASEPEAAEDWRKLGKAPACQYLIDRIHRVWGSEVQVTRVFLEQLYDALAQGRDGVFQLDAAHEIRTSVGGIQLKRITQPISARWLQYRQSLLGSTLPMNLGRSSRWQDDEADFVTGEKVSNDEIPPKKS